MSEIHLRLKSAAQKNNKLLFVLCDPDTPSSLLQKQVKKAVELGIRWFLVGGSHIAEGNTTATVELLKKIGAENVILFPGSELQVVPNTDAILFMSLISGRNPEYLIAKQVSAAPFVKKYNIEALPTGYMLVESGKLTSAQYISGTLPLPNDKPEIAAATAMAGELLGMQYFYLDAGSGAQFTIPGKIIEAVSKSVDGFIFIGGGIRTASAALNAWNHGAHGVVIGNGVFEEENLLETIFNAWKQTNQTQAK